MPRSYKKPDYPIGEQSIALLDSVQAIEDIGGLDPNELPDTGKDHNPGRGVYRRQLEKFSGLKEDDKLVMLRETWKDVAMGTATRAKAFVSTCSPKDFGSLQRLIISGAVAIDKAFPPKHEALAPKFIINMFGSLGQRAAAIAMPPTPSIIDITPQEVSCLDSPPPMTESSSQAQQESSPTTQL